MLFLSRIHAYTCSVAISFRLISCLVLFRKETETTDNGEKTYETAAEKVLNILGFNLTGPTRDHCL